ncbi:ABC-type antimicrobial peptide transport system, permease component [Chitinispirillum alkaliphilum]|nr:ABC-type antimicrobial peptide transport system, permease component [Chitinispirillum alkaliphilum]
MNLFESIRLAVGAIWAHRLRSLLTTLGVMIGVMTVIAMLALIDGINSLVANQLAALGTNTLYVQKFPWTMTREEMLEMRRRRNLTLDDASAVENQIDLAQRVAPMLSSAMAVRRGAIDLVGVEIIGTSPDYQFIAELDIESGRQMLPVDLTQSRQVAMIGATVARELFPAADPVGRRLLIGNRRFDIIAVLEEVGAVFGADQDNRVLIPISTYKKVFSGPVTLVGEESVTIIVQPLSPELIEETSEQIRELLRRRRGLSAVEDDDFSINTAEQLLETYRTLTSGVFGLMIGVTSLSLIVGGIGIMNIMLVSVSERIREIGIRKAVGARRRDIRSQFIIEAVVLSCAGGFIGMALGFMVAWGVSAVIDLPAAVTWWSILLGFGFSVMVGVFFGWYPSKRASEMDPIDALRRE